MNPVGIYGAENAIRAMVAAEKSMLENGVSIPIEYYMAIEGLRNFSRATRAEKRKAVVQIKTTWVNIGVLK
jgi:hypothetical protein